MWGIHNEKKMSHQILRTLFKNYPLQPTPNPIFHIQVRGIILDLYQVEDCASTHFGPF